MQKSNFDETVTKLATVQQARERYKLSRTMLMKIATESGAIRRFGRSVRIDIETLDKAVSENY